MKNLALIALIISGFINIISFFPMLKVDISVLSIYPLVVIFIVGLIYLNLKRNSVDVVFKDIGTKYAAPMFFLVPYTLILILSNLSGPAGVIE